MLQKNYVATNQNNEIVVQFLIKIARASTTQIKKEIPASVHLPSGQTSRLPSGGYSGKSIVAFTFKGTRYPARSWKELLITITNLMLSAHREQFDKVLNLVGRKRDHILQEIPMN